MASQMEEIRKILAEMEARTKELAAIPLERRKSEGGGCRCCLFRDLPRWVWKKAQAVMRLEGIPRVRNAEIPEAVMERLINNEVRTATQKVAKLAQVKRLRRVPELSFYALPTHDVRESPTKSTVCRERKAVDLSEYFVDMVHGHLALIRISKRWGVFFKNVYADEPDARELCPRHDWKNEPHGDASGCVGSKAFLRMIHDEGVDVSMKRISQAGLLWVEDYVA